MNAYDSGRETEAIVHCATAMCIEFLFVTIPMYYAIPSIRRLICRVTEMLMVQGNTLRSVVRLRSTKQGSLVCLLSVALYCTAKTRFRSC